MARGLSTASKMTITMQLKSMDLLLMDKRCAESPLLLTIEHMRVELKTYVLTTEGARSYRGCLCLPPFPAEEHYGAWVDSINSPEDSFSLPQGPLPFLTVKKDKYGGCAAGIGVNQQKVMQAKVRRVLFKAATGQVVGAVESVRVALVKSVMNERDFVDQMTMDIYVRSVQFLNASPFVVDWLFVLQNTADKIPNSRFSHTQRTKMRVLLQDFSFSTNPLRTESVAPSTGGGLPPPFESSTPCDNSQHRDVEINSSVTVRFNDFKMVKEGQSNVAESRYRVSMKAFSILTAQPVSELHNKYNLTVHRKTTSSTRFTEAGSTWSLRKLTVLMRMGAALELEYVRVERFQLDLTYLIKYFVRPSFRGGKSKASTVSQSPLDYRDGLQENSGVFAFNYRGDVNCEELSPLPPGVCEDGRESSRMVVTGPMTALWSYPADADRVKSCVEISTASLELWSSVAAAIKLLAAMSTIQRFVGRMTRAMSFVSQHGLSFDRYTSPSKSLSCALPSSRSQPEGSSYSLTLFQSSRVVVYIIVDDDSSSISSRPLREVDWSAIRTPEDPFAPSQTTNEEDEAPFDIPQTIRTDFSFAKRSLDASQEHGDAKADALIQRSNSQTILSSFANTFKKYSSAGGGGTLPMTLWGIRCGDLFDTGTARDGQDPAVKIRIGGKHFKTERFPFHSSSSPRFSLVSLVGIVDNLTRGLLPTSLRPSLRI